MSDKVCAQILWGFLNSSKYSCTIDIRKRWSRKLLDWREFNDMYLMLKLYGISYALGAKLFKNAIVVFSGHSFEFCGILVFQRIANKYIRVHYILIYAIMYASGWRGTRTQCSITTNTSWYENHLHSSSLVQCMKEYYPGGKQLNARIQVIHCNAIDCVELRCWPALKLAVLRSYLDFCIELFSTWYYLADFALRLGSYWATTVVSITNCSAVAAQPQRKMAES